MDDKMPRAEEEVLRESVPLGELGRVDLEGSEIAIKDLPPMPTPLYWERLSESTLGCVVVLMLIGLFVGLTHGVAVGSDPSGVMVIPLAFIYVEAAIAVVALCALLFSDPGVIHRSPETCYPIPREVLTRLAHGESLDGLTNLRHDGHTYCIRCLVWRPPAHGTRFSGSSSVHHCHTCQRCVRDFDHHCGVFGRCIAGKGWSGNMKWFKTILMMAAAALATTVVPLIIKILSISPKRVEPLA